MSNIATLQAEANRLRRELQEAEQRLRDAKVATCPAQIGSTVLYRGKEYRVTHIDTRWSPKFWLRGNPRRTNGTFGTRITHLYNDWTLVP